MVIPAPRPLLDRRVLFFGGKGGVGKTTLACAFALLSAERGERTLLVSTDPAHSTGDLLGLELAAEPQAVWPDLDALEIDPAREAERYINDVRARIADTTPPRLLAEVERQIDIARLSPGAEEAALFDRVTHLLDTPPERYRRIIFDTAPLGHTLRLLSLPEQMSAWMSGLIGRRRKVRTLGRMWRRVAGAAAADAQDDDDPVLTALEERRARFLRARRAITDGERTAFVFVATAERLSVLETQRAVQTVATYAIPIGGIVLNRLVPDAGAGSNPEERRWREGVHADALAGLFADYPVYQVPELPTEIAGADGLRRVISALPEHERAGADSPR